MVLLFCLCAPRILSRGGKRGALLKWVKILTAVALAIQFFINSVLVYAIACVLTGIPPDYTLVGNSVLLLPIIVAIIMLVLYGMVTFPVFFLALRLWKHTSHDDPHKSDLLYLAVMAFFIILQAIFNIWDTFLLQEGVKYPTLVLLLVWLCTPVIVYAAYRGYFASKPTMR